MAKETGSKNAMIKVLLEGMRGVYNTKDDLTMAWRAMLYDMNIDGNTWQRLLDRWHQKNKISGTTKKITALKGNINKALGSDKISWNSFLEGFSILGFDRLEIKITAYRKQTSRTIYLKINDLDKAAKDMVEAIEINEDDEID